MTKEQKIEDCEADCDCAEDMKAEEEINKIKKALFTALSL